MTSKSGSVRSRRRSIDPAEVRGVLGRHMLVDGFHLVVDLERSSGSRLYDSSSGKWYLDFYTFFASSPIGVNHPGLADADFAERLVRSSVNKPANSDVYTVEMAEFVETLSRLALPPSLPHLFLVAGGSVAVENGLKAAFDWKVRKNRARGLGDRGTQVIHFREAFHGRTGYALSLTNTDPVKIDCFPKFKWPRVDNPKVVFPLVAENTQAVERAERATVAQIEEAFAANPDDIAALIIEPIQGEGGDNHFRGEFLRELRRLCDEHDALLVLDEVQTGVGLTGKMWAYQHFDFEPDILCFGKKLQVCGIMVSRRIDEIPDNVFKVSSRINSTWGGSLTDMVRATRYLEIIAEDRLVENAAAMGQVLLDGLTELQSRHPEAVSQVRGRGLMCAFDLSSQALRKKTMDRCWANGLLMLASGKRGIRFRPALNVTRAEIEEGLALLERSVAEATEQP